MGTLWGLWLLVPSVLLLLCDSRTLNFLLRIALSHSYLWKLGTPSASALSLQRPAKSNPELIKIGSEKDVRLNTCQESEEKSSWRLLVQEHLWCPGRICKSLHSCWRDWETCSHQNCWQSFCQHKKYCFQRHWHNGKQMLKTEPFLPIPHTEMSIF